MKILEEGRKEGKSSRAVNAEPLKWVLMTFFDERGIFVFVVVMIERSMVPMRDSCALLEKMNR